ncbi:hypothetical protein [Paludibacterium paludis]|uniref:hypothetical protein n=1 Tax=Paludibacterium paludis TaxID=1225769 RepID=UPI0016743609|nr:hypothetical protein [Paludibacterium paludis]
MTGGLIGVTIIGIRRSSTRSPRQSAQTREGKNRGTAGKTGTPGDIGIMKISSLPNEIPVVLSLTILIGHGNSHD